MRVAIVAAGEMGGAIGARLVASGAEVRTSLAGRSEATVQRVRATGIGVAAGDADLVRGADIVLSVVPPGVAVALAERLRPALAAAERKPVYVDCNAIAPETAERVAAIVESADCPFVDGGIVGGPPGPGRRGPHVYVSGARAPAVTALVAYGLDVRNLCAPAGAASALKLAYAGVTKGLTAIGAATRAAAERSGVAEALRAEVVDSQPELTAWLDRQIPSMEPKAYRWVAEMDEIARFLGAPGDGADIYSGAARFYERVARERR